ncbi:carbonic anhydrase [Sphingomonas sp.]|uniref:carbonic anhydrase n=1 Tax=Sphingomonas sp. TaxID=28214 RepID=UPI003AFFA2A9
MQDLIGRVLAFQNRVFPDQSALYTRLARHGQSPKALMISCADSRVIPEEMMQAGPGELFVCRNAGNIVPPFATQNGGVSSTVEYAVAALGVRDIVVCGHSDCGAMKALMAPETLAGMPNVAAWLKHSSAAREVVCSSYKGIEGADAARAAAQENVVIQLAHLRTHPSVAAGIAQGEIALHGWFFDIEKGDVLALDGVSGRFVAVREGMELPVALPAATRRAYDQDSVVEVAA